MQDSMSLQHDGQERLHAILAAALPDASITFRELPPLEGNMLVVIVHIEGDTNCAAIPVRLADLRRVPPDILGHSVLDTIMRNAEQSTGMPALREFLLAQRERLRQHLRSQLNI